MKQAPLDLLSHRNYVLGSARRTLPFFLSLCLLRRLLSPPLLYPFHMPASKERIVLTASIEHIWKVRSRSIQNASRVHKQEGSRAGGLKVKKWCMLG